MAVNKISIDFIHSSYSQAPGSGGRTSQRRVHSHAARQAHARVRRQRLAEYQSTRTKPKDSGDEKTPFIADLEVPLIINPVELLASGRRDPFGSFARQLNSTEDFLLDYYMQNIVPCEEYQRERPRAQSLTSQFVQLAMTKSDSLDGLFLVSCRHLSISISRYMPQSMTHKGPDFVQLALQYKIACTQSLRGVISCLDTQSSIGDWAVGMVLFLAQDEVLAGDVSSTQKHIQGAIQMYKHNGALNKTGLGGFPYDVIQKDMPDTA